MTASREGFVIGHYVSEPSFLSLYTGLSNFIKLINGFDCVKFGL
jgi:hypothetical protein